MNFNKHLPRPRIQRAFVHWLNENWTRFAVPVRLPKISARGVEVNFLSYPDCLNVQLSNHDLAVQVKWQGDSWDRLIDLDVLPCHAPDGYKCRCCYVEHGESVSIFPSREALWKDHLFEPFLKWVNEELALARWLRVSCTGDRETTWAQLIQDESKLSAPDRTRFLLQGLKRIDGKKSDEGGEECVTSWLIPLNEQ